MRPNLINRLKEEWNNLDPVDPLRGLIADAIDALAEQLAQQESEAVRAAWMAGYTEGEREAFENQSAQQQDGPINEGWQITVTHGHSGYGVYAHMEDYPEEGAVFVMPIEQPAQQQEPVAYSYTSRITGAQGFSHHPMPRFIDSESWDIHPLYTSPPASKPWVGLTDVERIELMEKTHPKNRWPLLALCEDKLREKNT